MTQPDQSEATGVTACPTCGQSVEVVTSGEGTSHYVGIDAWDASMLRTEREAAILSATMKLRQALEAIYTLPNARSRGQGANRVSVLVSMQEARDIARSALDEE